MNTDKRSKIGIRNLLAMIGLALLLISGMGGPVSAASGQAPAMEIQLEMHDESGVLIVSVLPDSPADEAGISRGDIVLAVDGEPIDNAENFAGLIGDLEPGDEVVLTVLHGDDTLELSAILGQRNGRTFLGVVPYVADEPDVAKADPKSDDADTEEPNASDDAGEADTVPGDDDVDGPDEENEEAISPRTLMRGMMPFGQGGALISQVVADGPAAEAGLMAGDLIVAVDGEALGEGADLADLIGGYAPGDDITLTVHNVESNEKLEVPVTLGTHPDDDERAFLGVAYMIVPTLPGMGDVLPDEEIDEDTDADENEAPVEQLPGRLMTPSGEGAIIADVVSGGPADDAGLVIGDLIVAVNGEELKADVDLAELIGSFSPGDEIVLTIHNPEANETMEVPITLGAHPDDEERAFLGIAYAIAPLLGGPEGENAENDALEEDSTEGSETDMDGDDDEAIDEGDEAGEQADPADVEKSDQADVTSPRRQARIGLGGAMISDVVDGGPADKAGLAQGDVIVAIDGEKLTGDTDLGDRIASYAPGDEVTLTVHSRNSRETKEMTVTLGAHPEDEAKAFLGIAYVSAPERKPNSRYQRGPAPIVPRQGEQPEDKDGCFHGYSPEDHEGHHGRFHGEGHEGHPECGNHDGMMMPFFHHGMGGHGFEGFDLDSLSEEDLEALQEMFPFLFSDGVHESEPGQ